jgi:hypothetical protein
VPKFFEFSQRLETQEWSLQIAGEMGAGWVVHKRSFLERREWPQFFAINARPSSFTSLQPFDYVVYISIRWEHWIERFDYRPVTNDHRKAFEQLHTISLKYR